ncbi:hypothetical protein ACEPAG_9191 [Sanghuangporus baumii]
MAPPVSTTPAPATQPAVDYTAMAQAIALALRSTNAGGGSKKGVAPPREFSGGDNYVDFRREVLLYLTSYESRFQDDKDKIMFVLSYLKSGSASTWAENYVEWASQSGSLTITDTWAAFLDKLNISFEDPNRHQKAFDKLDKMRQGEQEADKFLNDFDIERVRAGLTKSEHDGTLIAKLMKALNSAVVKGVMRTDPAPTTYAQWRKRAVTVDNVERQIKYVHAQRRGQQHLATLPARQQAFARPYAQAPQQPARPMAPFPQVDRRDATGVTYRGLGQPMDIAMNQARARRACYKCGKVGHFIRDCPRGREAIRSIIAALKPEDRLAFLEELGNAKESDFDSVDVRAVPAELEEIVDDEGFQDNQA